MEVILEEVHVHFGTIRALDGIDARFLPGEVTLLAGPNGAGKSTLLGLPLGLVRPDSGRMLVDERDLLALGHGARRRFRDRLGYLPESVAFSENLSGRQVLRFFAKARGVDGDRSEEVLERVGLADAAGRAVRGYSRGMRQRLGLGIAILSEPELLILDEPTGGLDQEGLSLLWSVLAQWKEAGRTVILSTHDLALVERRSDRVHLLSAGRMVASGTPDALRRMTRLPVRLRLVMHDHAAAKALAARFDGREGLTSSLKDRHLGVSVARDDILDVMRTIQEQGAVVDLRVEEPGLDDVYERLLERT